MCGIVGFVSGTPTAVAYYKRQKFLRQALFLDTLRGKDATGIFYHTFKEMEEGSTESAYWLKNAVPAPEFLDCKEFNELSTKMGDWAFCVGHNRAATKGAKGKVDNAHPFQENDITLVHNGTLTSSYDLPGGGMHKLGVEVDSHAICHNLATHTADEVIKNMSGAFALVWHDARDQSLNFIRNAERPLYLGECPYDNTIYFMSELKMLQLLDDRLTLGIKQYYTLAPGILLTIWPGQEKAPVLRKLELYSKPAYNPPHYSGYRTYPSYDWAEERSRQRGFGSRWGLYDDDDDSFYSPKETPRLGKSLAPSAIQQAELLNLGLTVEDRLHMAIKTVHSMTKQEGEPRSIIQGSVNLGEKPLDVWVSVPSYKAQGWSFDLAEGKKWTVRPVAVRYDGSHKSLVCDLVCRGAYSDEKFAADTLNWYPAGDDVWLDEGSWIAKDMRCTLCTMPHTLEDAYDIIWDEDYVGMCSACQDFITFPAAESV